MKTVRLASTIRRRDQLGSVAIFDSLRTTNLNLQHGATLVGWSPLHAATTADLAQQTASQLLDAAPAVDHRRTIAIADDTRSGIHPTPHPKHGRTQRIL